MSTEGVRRGRTLRASSRIENGEGEEEEGGEGDGGEREGEENGSSSIFGFFSFLSCSFSSFGLSFLFSPSFSPF